MYSVVTPVKTNGLEKENAEELKSISHGGKHKELTEEKVKRWFELVCVSQEEKISLLEQKILQYSIPKTDAGQTQVEKFCLP